MLHCTYTCIRIDCICCQIGESGRSTRELEKTIALLKKVVERTQQENEQLKKAPGVVSQEQVRMLRGENQGLKVSICTEVCGWRSGVSVLRLGVCD